ncbi:MAG: nuclear transport factor 2 family protein [Burkholderiales bacterium]
MRLRRAAVFTAALLAVGLLAGCTGLTAAVRPDPAADIATLTRQAAAWDRAIVRKDRPAIAANMTADFRQIGSAGEIENHDSFLNDIVSDELMIDPYTVEDFEVRVYGDTALLSGRTRMTGRYAGKPFDTHYRYIDVYVRVGGEWKVCSVQTTRVAER